MGEPKMAAEERIYPHVLLTRSLDRPNPELVGYRVVQVEEAIRACDAHAAAAVKALEARVAELERERDEARAERDFQAERAQVNVDLRVKAEARIAELERERDALREAVTPSGATKAAYSGEVKNHGAPWDDYVSWSAIKEIMKLIRQRAALGKEAQP